eukprot:s2232_g10.t1
MLTRGPAASELALAATVVSDNDDAEQEVEVHIFSRLLSISEWRLRLVTTACSIQPQAWYELGPPLTPSIY